MGFKYFKSSERKHGVLVSRFVLQLIHLYGSKLCLNDVSTENIHNRMKKNKAYEEIRNHLRLESTNTYILMKEETTKHNLKTPTKL